MLEESCRIRLSNQKFEEVVSSDQEKNLLASRFFYLLLQYTLLPPALPGKTKKRKEELAIDKFYDQLSLAESEWLTERDPTQGSTNTRAQIIRLAVDRRVEEILEAARAEQPEKVAKPSA